MLLNLEFFAQRVSQFPCGMVNCESGGERTHVTYVNSDSDLIIYIILIFNRNLSDQVTPGLSGLADLGVEPSALETIAISVLRRHRDVFFFDDAMDSDAPCRPTSSYAAQ